MRAGLSATDFGSCDKSLSEGCAACAASNASWSSCKAATHWLVVGGGGGVGAGVASRGLGGPNKRRMSLTASTLASSTSDACSTRNTCTSAWLHWLSVSGSSAPEPPASEAL